MATEPHDMYKDRGICIEKVGQVKSAVEKITFITTFWELLCKIQ